MGKELAGKALTYVSANIVEQHGCFLYEDEEGSFHLIIGSNKETFLNIIKEQNEIAEVEGYDYIFYDKVREKFNKEGGDIIVNLKIIKEQYE